MGINFVIEGTQQFFQSSMTTIESTTASLNDIYFPSVYICNINQVTKTSMTKMGIENDREIMEDLFWHYVKGQTKMYTDKTFEENELKTDLNVTHLESLMKKIGWDEDVTFLELVKQFCLPIYIGYFHEPTCLLKSTFKLFQKSLQQYDFFKTNYVFKKAKLFLL